MKIEEIASDQERIELIDQLTDRLLNVPEEDPTENNFEPDLEMIPEGSAIGNKRFYQLMAFMARMSNFAYKDDIESIWSPKYKPSAIKRDDIFAFTSLYEEEGQLIVSFRGTDPKKLMNLLRGGFTIPTIGTPITNEFLLTGFKSAYMKIRKGVRENINQRVRKENLKQVHFCGHSLGGVMAHLCTMDYIKNPLPSRPDIGFLATFGQPGSGLPGFAQETDRIIRDKVKYSRFVNGNDVIPRYPNDIMKLHAGKLRKINYSQGRASSANGEAEPQSFWEMEKEQLRSLLAKGDEEFATLSNGWSLHDHQIKLYMFALDRLAKKYS